MRSKMKVFTKLVNRINMNTLCTTFTLSHVFTGKSIRNMNSPTEQNMFKVDTEKCAKFGQFLCKDIETTPGTSH